MLIPWSSHGFLPRSRRVDDRSQGWDACARLGLWRLLCHPGLSFSAQKLLADGVYNTFYLNHNYVYIYIDTRICLCIYICRFVCIYNYKHIYIDTYIVCWYYVQFLDHLLLDGISWFVYVLNHHAGVDRIWPSQQNLTCTIILECTSFLLKDHYQL